MLENGNLKHFNVADLINILGQSQKTGELTINAREHQGTLYFQNGNLIHASHGTLSGEEVVYELMACDSGDFSFVEKPVGDLRSITKDAEALIREGGIRSEIISRLAQKSFRGSPNSHVHLLPAVNSNLSEAEQKIITILEAKNDLTVIRLFSRLAFDLEQYVGILNNLADKGIIELQKSDEECFWLAFEQLVNTFYLEFTSISGLKMSKDLDKKIQDLIHTNTWNLTFKDGRIYTNELFNFPVEEQWKIYSVFLDELLGYFNKVYGEGFTGKVLTNLVEVNPHIDKLVKKLGK